MTPSTILLLTLATAVPSASQRETIRNIEARLMAPCCYTQTIDVHESDIAQQMRSEVTEMVMEGKSEPEIITYYKTEYGESILAVPDGRTGTVAFAIPIIVSNNRSANGCTSAFRRDQEEGERSATTGSEISGRARC
jgi:cytochrome c-type biogenesis protein CcmH/NrfF